MTDHSKFREELPPKAAFYNDLTGEDISDEDYKFVEDIYDDFLCCNLGDLHDM